MLRKSKKNGAPFGNQNAKGHGAPKGNRNAAGPHVHRKPQRWTDEVIDEEAEYLLEWAHDDNSLVMGTCYGSRGYSTELACKWAKTHEKFATYKELAKTIVGARREHGAIMGWYDSNLIKAAMATYDPEYRAFLKEMKRDVIMEELSQEQAAKDISEYIKNHRKVKNDVAEAA